MSVKADTAPNYRLICGQYVLHHGDKPVSAPVDEVAIGFSREAGVLHRHGKPEVVNQWAATARQRMRTGGSELGSSSVGEEMAADITVMQGRFTLEDLNYCLVNSAHVSEMYARVMTGKLQALDVLGRQRLSATS